MYNSSPLGLLSGSLSVKKLIGQKMKFETQLDRKVSEYSTGGDTYSDDLVVYCRLLSSGFQDSQKIQTSM